jgi:hypothetical protein
LISLQFHGQQIHSREKTKPSAPSRNLKGAATRKIKTVSKGGPPADLLNLGETCGLVVHDWIADNVI